MRTASRKLSIPPATRSKDPRGGGELPVSAIFVEDAETGEQLFPEAIGLAQESTFLVHGRRHQGRWRLLARERGTHGISAVWPDGLTGLGDRLWLLGDRRHVRADRRRAIPARSTESNRQRHQLLRYRGSLWDGRLRASTGAGARAALGEERSLWSPSSGSATTRCPTAATASVERVMASIEKSLQRAAGRTISTSIWCIGPTLIRRSTKRCALLDDIVLPRQGALYRRVQFSRWSSFEALHAAATDRCRAIWLEHVRPAHADRDFSGGAASYRRNGRRLIRLRHAHRTFSADTRFEESDWRSRQGNVGSLNLFRTLFGPDEFPRNLRAVDELKALAAEYRKTLPQFALRWATSNLVVSTALVGFRHPAEVEENLGALGWTISAEDLAAIDEIFARHGAVTVPPGGSRIKTMIAPIVIPAKPPNWPRKLEAHSELPSGFALSPRRAERGFFSATSRGRRIFSA